MPVSGLRMKQAAANRLVGLILLRSPPKVVGNRYPKWGRVRRGMAGILPVWKWGQMQRTERESIPIRVERVSETFWRVFVQAPPLFALGPEVMAELDALVEWEAGSERLRAVVFEWETAEAGRSVGEGG